MVINQNRFVRWWLCGMMLIFISPLWAATIKVQSDRNPVAMNESFRLTFEADGAVDGDPDFKLLEQDFEIRHQSQGTSMQIINGKVSQTRQWTVVLIPRRSGRLVVPAISFGDDRSEPLVIGVNAAAPAPAGQSSALFIEVNAESSEAYVQSQVIYRAKLFRAVNVANATLSEPQVSGVDAVVEKLGEDREYETTRDGRRFVVLERSYAIFPQHSGALTIAPLTFEGQVVNRSRGMFDVFEPGGPIRRVRSDAVEVEVKAVPATADSQQWLPAREVRLVEEWPEGLDLTQPVMAGEPLTWTLTLIANGLTAAQLPAITPTMPDGMKAYPDQARQLNDKKQGTLIGMRQEKIALIPTEAGQYRLPAIEIPWWNSETAQREIARLPERTLRVKAAQVDGAITAQAFEELPVSEMQHDAVGTPADGRWRMISGVLGLGWLATILAWLLVRRSPRDALGADTHSAPAAASYTAVKKAMQLACHNHDKSAAKDALLAWGRVHWPQKPPASLGELAQQTDGLLRDEIMRLNQLLYSRHELENDDHWDGAQLLAGFLSELPKRAKKSAEHGAPLAPMYP